MATNQTFTKGVGWMAMGNWSEQLVNFLVFMALSRLLGAEAFGLLSMAMVFVLIGEGLVRETLSDFVFSARDLKESDIDTVFWILTALGLLFTVVLIAVAPLVAEFYGQELITQILRAFAPIVVLTAITAVPVALLRRQMRMRPLGERALAGVVVGGAVGLVMALTGFGVWALVGQRIALTLTNVIWAWVALRWLPGWRFDIRRLRELAIFGGQVTGLRAAELANEQMPSVVIGASLGPVALGYYTIAWRLVEIGSFLIVTPLRTAALPAFAQRWIEGANPGGLFLDILRVTSFVALPAFLGLSLVAEPLVIVFGGMQWQPAASVLAILSFYGFYLCVARIEEAFAFANGHVRELAVLANVALILRTSALVLFSSRGLEEMVAAFVMIAFLTFPMRWWLIGRHAGLTIPSLMRPHMATLLAGAVMVMAVMAVAPVTGEMRALPELLFSALIGALVYATIALLVMRRRLAMTRDYLTGLVQPTGTPKTRVDRTVG
jgi:PST family polysaccharide transporter